MAGRFKVETVFTAIDKITRPVKGMQTRMQKFSSTINRGLRSVHKTMGVVAAGFMRGARSIGIGIGLVAASVALLTREFSKIENAQAAFTPILGGVEEAKRLVDLLNETAATTPFQFEDIANAASQLLPAMNGDIEETVKTFRMLGDTAGGSVEKLNRIASVYSRVLLKNKLETGDLNILTERGIPIYKELSKSMGVTVAEMAKMATTGKITGSDLTKAFQAMTSEGGVFFEGMAIASKTLTGVISTMKDNISIAAATIGELLTPKVKELAGMVTGVANQIKVWAEANADFLAIKIEAGFAIMLNALVFIGKTLAFIWKHKKVLGFVAIAIYGIVVAFSALNVVLAVLNMVGAPVIAIFWLVAIVIGVIVAAIVGLIWYWNKLTGKMGDTSVFDKLESKLAGFKGGMDLDGEVNLNTTSSGASGSQVVGQEERMARSFSENKSTSEVVIRDESGRAEVTKGGGVNSGMTLATSGAF